MLKTIFEWDNDKANGSVYKWDDSEDESVAVLKTKTRNGEEFILVKGDIKPLIQGDGIDIEKAKETCQIITLSKDEFIKLSSCIYK